MARRLVASRDPAALPGRPGHPTRGTLVLAQRRCGLYKKRFFILLEFERILHDET
jgi:hypothetical protein